MKRKLIIPATIAAGSLGLAGVLPAAYAGSYDKEKSMEERAEAAESKMERHAETAGAKMERYGEAGESAIKDAWLHGKLETALLFNEHLNSFDIDTDVENGTAYLRGVVESDIDRDLAEEIAKSIEGVTDVENDLEVDEEKARTARNDDDDDSMERQGFRDKVMNATLTARIKSRLLVNDNTGGMSIDVDSRDGVVTLSGEVDSEQEKELAMQIASNTEGTTSVNNQLTVEASEEAE